MLKNELFSCISGFDELSQQDQIKLIKQGSFEVMLIRYARCLQEDGMFVPTMEFKIPRLVCEYIHCEIFAVLLTLLFVSAHLKQQISYFTQILCEGLIRK